MSRLNASVYDLVHDEIHIITASSGLTPWRSTWSGEPQTELDCALYRSFNHGIRCLELHTWDRGNSLGIFVTSRNDPCWEIRCTEVKNFTLLDKYV